MQRHFAFANDSADNAQKEGWCVIKISRDRINTCVAKVAYPTRLAAELARNALIRKHGVKERLYVYRCPWAEGHYHLGRVRRRKHVALVDDSGGTLDWRNGWGIGDDNYGSECEG